MTARAGAIRAKHAVDDPQRQMLPRPASQRLSKRGDEAATHAAMRADELLDAGDIVGSGGAGL